MEQPSAPGPSENSLIKERRDKLARLREKGIDPFKNKFTPTVGCGEARARYVAGEFKEGQHVEIAGRISSMRDMGKSQFVDLKDGGTILGRTSSASPQPPVGGTSSASPTSLPESPLPTAATEVRDSQRSSLHLPGNRIQIYAQKQTLGDEQFDIFKHLDLGDFIGVKGEMFTTKAGEPSVKITSFVILAKALRPPPAKWHGLEDTEIRYRQRYLDLMANDEVKQTFLKRSAIVHEIRQFFHSRGYVEVETPAMQAIPGGAAAQPFKTFHNALGCDFYLRIALELYHKRLLVGGIDKLFEIGKNFRNEGLSRRHNPEFTMLEAYQAFGDYESMMETVEALITTVAEKVLGGLVIETKDMEGKVIKSIDLTPRWKRARYKDLVKEKAGADWFDISPAERRQRAHDLGAEIGKEYEDFEVTGAVFEKLIEPTLIQPTFVTHLPKELVPLAKISPDDPTTVEVFECCINGQEIAPGYTEQNDPIAQRNTLEHQAGGEQQKLDEDFLVALEHGMPPAGGIGIGIDRLCMMLLGQESIRDVILFPQLKPK
jgi:lysyl-tRNA synthetase, class II